jgi:Domain of unknown function (DUF4234)
VNGSEHVRNIVLDIVLVLVTCHLWTLYVQHRQMVAVNAMLRENKYSWGLWFILSLITCGIYHIYHEYRKSSDIDRVLKVQSNEPVINILLTIFGLTVVADALQQAQINRFYGSHSL